jgi:hypothetical protein
MNPMLLCILFFPFRHCGSKLQSFVDGHVPYSKTSLQSTNIDHSLKLSANNKNKARCGGRTRNLEIPEFRWLET